MDEQTALVMALQLIAVFSIAGALLVYLLCKIRAPGGSSDANERIPGAGKPILITSCDNAFGLQIALHLANRGFRVFAGLKEGAAAGTADDTVQARIIRSWQKQRDSSQILCQGSINALPLDVTREDLLHEAVDIIRAHLPAGEDGIWAVINTSGITYKGRLDQQDISHWDTMLKTNLVGLLRTARTFQSLLRSTQGRIITIGATEDCDAGLVAYNASRYAVEGASNSLRQELLPLGIKVITLHPTGIPPEMQFVAPRFLKKEENTEYSVDITGCIEYQPVLLSSKALQIIDIAVTSGLPKNSYDLSPKYPWSSTLLRVKTV